MIRIYLDVCCLCRPFDDHDQFRIRQEAEAIKEILKRCSDSWTLIGSEMIDEEVSRIVEISRRDLVMQSLKLAREYISIDETIKTRTYELRYYGIHAVDAIHIACAEKADAIFITADDQVLNVTRMTPDITKTPVIHPVQWLMEDHENGC
jgi:predicted nucleic acid-binding protein